MRKIIGVIALFVMSLAAFCQSTPKCEVATIIKVAAHQAAGETISDATSFDVSVRVGDVVYVVLYTPPMGELPPTYVTGRQLLVLVGKNTLTYNNMVGESLQVPIETQRSAAEPER